MKIRIYFEAKYDINEDKLTNLEEYVLSDD